MGLVGFGFLASLQMAKGVSAVAGDVAQDFPERSRSSDLRALIDSRSDLHNAIITSDTDYMLETLPYYIDNQTYLIRCHCFGNVVRFSRAGKLSTNLGEILEESRTLHKTKHVPIVILLKFRLDEIEPGKTYHYSYNWTFSASTDDIVEFKNSTKLLKSFAPTKTDESYDVYLLN